MAQDRNLPEGTDKIIPGAGETVEEVVVVEAVVAEPANPRSGGAGGMTGQASTNAGTTGATGQAGGAGGPQGGGSQSRGGGGGEPRGGGGGEPRGGGGGQSGGGGDRSGGNEGRSGKIMDKVRSGGEKISGQAADKARDFVGQGLERSGDALSNVSRLVSDTATGLDERLGPEYGDYARRAAEAIDSTAQKLRSKNPDELIDDTRDFVRKSPGVALAGAAIVGFALARLVKSGLDAGTRGQNEREGGTGEGGGGNRGRGGGEA